MSTSKIHCVVDINAKPESVDKVRSVLLKFSEYSRAEDGCLYYNILENINDKCQFTFIEIWSDQEAFDNHLQSDHVQQGSFEINNDVIRPPDIKLYKSMQDEPQQMIHSRTSRFCVIL